MATEKTDDITIPGEPKPEGSSAIDTLTVIATALTTASIIVNVILQLANHFKKRPVESNQRDRIATAGLALSLLRQMPGAIKQARLLASQIRGLR